MAFESLTDKLQNVFRNLRSKGRLTEARDNRFLVLGNLDWTLQKS